MNIFSFNKVYWLLIGGSIIAHTIAAILTYIEVVGGNSMECNTTMANMFSSIGHFPAYLLSIIILLAASIFAIHATNKGNIEKLKVSTVVILSMLFFIMFIDALNDVLVVMHNPLSSVTLDILRMFFVVMPFGC